MLQQLLHRSRYLTALRHGGRLSFVARPFVGPANPAGSFNHLLDRHSGHCAHDLLAV
jgi:hypothetical protein